MIGVPSGAVVGRRRPRRDWGIGHRRRPGDEANPEHHRGGELRAAGAEVVDAVQVVGMLVREHHAVECVHIGIQQLLAQIGLDTAIA